MNLMDRLSRIFARTPSLRTRVAFATAIGAAIVVVIVGTIVWVGITNDRKERLDRRLDEAAGFAIPFLPRGLDEIPRSPNDQDAVITVRKGGQVTSNSNVVLPELPAGLTQTPSATACATGCAPAQIRCPSRRQWRSVPGLRRHHRRHRTTCTDGRVPTCFFLIGAAAVLGWAVSRIRGAAARSGWPSRPGRSTPATLRPTSRSAAPARPSRSPTPSRACCSASGRQQDRTKAALASARDFSFGVVARTAHAADRDAHSTSRCCPTLDLPDEQRKEVINDVIRTQSRIEATLTALERLAQGELSTADDHVPVDITELLDRAAHDAMRVYPDLDVSLVPAPTVIIVGLPAGLRLAVDNAIANAVKHGGATRVQLSAVSSRAGVEIAIDDDGVGVPDEERKVVFDRFSRGSTASHSGSGLGLALVAQQAELHGGTASLEASPLGGARLLLRLPGPR